MDAETLKYLDALKDDIHKQFDSMKDVIKDGLNGLEKRINNVERDTSDLEKEFRDYIKEQKDKEEKKENRGWDVRKTLIVMIVGGVSLFLITNAINIVANHASDTKKYELEIKKIELEKEKLKQNQK